ncbi:MAG: hypothetical protein B6241_14665 [Spirochaetaceae bacterium 4572_59]|nr:MAG: hypothetical protein B6241_14665 [Spirochaetaceae bacterium 4572_59]
MLIIGHRGASELAPENTLKSIQRALDDGVEMIEIDVSICQSGEAVVMHNIKVDKTTNGSGYIKNLPLKEIRELDAGEGEKVPLLQEVIDLIDSRCPLNIEIKGRGSAQEVSRILENEIRKGRSWDDFMVSSFDHFELQEFGKLRQEVRISPIICGLPLGLASFTDGIKAWSLNMNMENVCREIVEDAHKKGLKVLIFTVNDPDELAYVSEIGVDGVFTNNKFRLLGIK